MTRMRWCRSLAVSLALTGGVALVGAASPAVAGGARSPELAFRGEVSLPSGGSFQGTTVGGLSSITYDPARDLYYVLSDDQVNARFYTLRLLVADGSLDAGDVAVTAVTTLRGLDGQPFPAGSLDPEGLTLTRRGTLIVTSEGFALPGKEIPPFVREFSLGGAQLREFELPEAYSPVVGIAGVRNNLGFESAAVTPNGRDVYTATENALVQDGPAATLAGGSPSRLLRYDTRTGRLERQFVYQTEPVAAPAIPPGGFTVNGLVELLPLRDRSLIAMERSFSVGAGNSVKLFEISLRRATDVTGVGDLDDAVGFRPVDKRLLLDLDTLGLTLDNLEGMTLGPGLPHGGRALVMVSDDNFAATQVSQFLLFSVT